MQILRNPLARPVGQHHQLRSAVWFSHKRINNHPHLGWRAAVADVHRVRVNFVRGVVRQEAFCLARCAITDDFGLPKESAAPEILSTSAMRTNSYRSEESSKPVTVSQMERCVYD